MNNNTINITSASNSNECRMEVSILVSPVAILLVVDNYESGVMNVFRINSSLGVAISMSACTGTAMTNAKLVEEPPITEIITPFDQALTCLDGELSQASASATNTAA